MFAEDRLLVLQLIKARRGARQEAQMYPGATGQVQAISLLVIGNQIKLLVQDRREVHQVPNTGSHLPAVRRKPSRLNRVGVPHRKVLKKVLHQLQHEEKNSLVCFIKEAVSKEL
jgi:hypothetical protein